MAVLPMFAEGHDCVVAYEHTARGVAQARPMRRDDKCLCDHTTSKLFRSPGCPRTPCTTLRRYDSLLHRRVEATANSP
jgi:hypothetical protein